jgi:hypothetical protein
MTKLASLFLCSCFSSHHFAMLLFLVLVMNKKQRDTFSFTLLLPQLFLDQGRVILCIGLTTIIVFLLVFSRNVVLSSLMRAIKTISFS